MNSSIAKVRRICLFFLSSLISVLPGEFRPIDKHARASELTHHNCLQGVIVQSETDVIKLINTTNQRNKKR